MFEFIKIRIETAPLLVLCYILSSCFLYLTTSQIVGPFIFGDELTYYKLGYGLFANNEWDNSHYNPLYPFIISVLHHFGGDIFVYQALRLINILVFSTIIFPVAKFLHIFINKSVALLLSVTVVLMPWSSVLPIIWAEPFFYAAAVWSMYFYYSFLVNKRHTSAFLLGTSVGILFLIKQSGLIIAAAYIVGILYDYLKIEHKTINYWPYIIGMISSLIFIAPLIIFNALNSDTSPLGYQSSIDSYELRDFFDLKYYAAVLYELGYIVLSTYVIFSIYFTLSFFSWKKHSVHYRSFLLSVLVYLILIVILTALHRYNSIDHYYYSLAYGRYLAFAIILIFLIAWIEMFNNAAGAQLKTILPITFFALAIVLLFSPLNSLTAYGVVNNFDLSFLNIFNKVYISWDTYRSIDAINVNGIFFYYCLSSLLIYYLLYKKYNLPLVITISSVLFFSGWNARSIVANVAGSTSGLNLAMKQAINININKYEIYIDQIKSGRQVEFIYDFWLHEKVKYAFPEYRVDQITYDFGTPMSPIIANAIAVQAPWEGAAQYTKDKGWGFESLYNIDSRYDEVRGVDWIFGWKTQTFKVNLPPGVNVLDLYTFSGNPTKTSFDVKMDGQVIFENVSANIILSHRIDNHSQKYMEYTLTFMPKSDKHWSISKIVQKAEMYQHGNAIVISDRDLPYLNKINGKVNNQYSIYK